LRTFISWWLIIEILGWVAFPIAYRTLRWLPERGYVFSKALGLLISSYLVWLGATTGFLRNDLVGVLFAVLAVLGFSGYLIIKGGQASEMAGFLRQNKRLILVVELLFALAFVAWIGLRAFAPDKVMSAGGEKFMEMAFLNSVLNSPRFPPPDPWLSGFAISYYYFGYVMMGILTRFSGVPAGVGFELYDALVFALAVIGVFGVIYNLVAVGGGVIKHIGSPDKPKAPGQPLLFGLLGALLVMVMGNLEGLLESLHTRGVFSSGAASGFWRWLDIPGLINSPVTGGWMPADGFFGFGWRATRILQDYDLRGQVVINSPISEFPLFSFLLGDNHPHVLALPFSLLLIAMAFNLLLRQRNRPFPAAVEKQGWKYDLSFLLDGEWFLLIIYALCLGALGFLNTWDMPIYLALLALAFAIGEHSRQGKLERALVLRTAALAIVLLTAAILFYLFFYISFQSQAGGILPYLFKPTRLPQYLVMFGAFIYILFCFLLVSGIDIIRGHGVRRVLRIFLSAWGWVLAGCLALIAFFILTILPAANRGQLDNPAVQSLLGGETISQALTRLVNTRLMDPWLLLLLTGLLALTIANLLLMARGTSGASAVTASKTEGTTSPSNQFVFLLILLGLSLTLSVELVYLRDSFGVRLNTVFKFYYQAWIMLGCASAYALWWIGNGAGIHLRVAWRGIILAGAAVLIGAGLTYSLSAGYVRVDGFRASPNLDATVNLADANPDDWAAINWLKNNGRRTHDNPVTILEAPGTSYSYKGRISAFSGFPALLGWATHESQWRGNYDEQGRREPDIQTIYSTKSGDLALELLQKWNVDYVIVGTSEINYIEQICGEPSRVCDLRRALRKFDQVLIPVFEQGTTKIYQVPEM
jgi:YYY domain-containing protein